MEIWQYWIIFGLGLFILEMFTPALFFLNLAFAALVTAVCAFFGISWLSQTIVFALSSVLLLVFLRPLMRSGAKKNVPLEDTYIGKTAEVVEKVDEASGRIKIYSETWQARSSAPIEVGKTVKILKIESIIMYVEEVQS